MDYYQKYQKYKFKYLNLLSLNQSGGYTNDEFKIMLENTDVNGYFVDKLAICPISHDIVHKDHAVLIEKAIYDVNYLLNFFISYQKRTEEENYILNPKIPHNNGRFTEEIYLKILSKVLKNNLDHKIIFKMSSVSELVYSIVTEYILDNTIIIDYDTINFLIDYSRIEYSIKEDKDKTYEKNKKIMYEILQLRNFSEDIQQRILKLEYKYRTRLLSFYNPEKIIYILNNLIDDDIKKLFDDNNPYDLYPLNISDLKTYINK